MRYATLLIILLIMTFPNGASAIESTLKCEIKDQQILEIKDGVSERYAAYEGDFEVGDNFLLTYGLSLSNVFYLRSERIPKGGFLSKFNINFVFNTAEATVVDENTATKHSLENDGFLSTQMTFSANSFDIGYVFAEGGFRFERYYKSDWVGIYTYITSLSSHSYTLDCKHITESVWSEVFLKLKRALGIWS